MADFSHRIVGKAHSVAGEIYAIGEGYSPSDDELAAFPDRFEAVTDTDSEASGDADSEAAEPLAVLRDYVDDPGDYNALRALATEFDDVPASGIGKADLQQRLADAVRAADTESAE